VNEPYTTDRALALLPFGAMLGACGLDRLLERPDRRWRAVQRLLLAAVVAQFAYFYGDYLTGYRTRSAFWFNGNNRGALEAIIASNPSEGAHPVYLAENIPFIRFYWTFYLAKHHRNDLLARTVYFGDALDAATVPADSFILTNAGDRIQRALVASRRFDETEVIMEPDGAWTFVRFRKR
jgi:hypothetical protein